jgi:ribosome modulation factor
MPLDDEERDEAFSLCWEAGIDGDEINTCPYTALDPCRAVWIDAYGKAADMKKAGA